jgi:hypothetical protein
MKPMHVKHIYLSEIFKESNFESRDFSVQATEIMKYHFEGLHSADGWRNTVTVTLYMALWPCH